MPEAIGPLNRTPGLGPLSPVRPQPKARDAGPNFGEGLGRLVAQVNEVQHEATDAINRLAEGQGAGGESLHEVMLAVSKAELSFNFVMEARNKLVEAYQEVMRMSL